MSKLDEKLGDLSGYTDEYMQYISDLFPNDTELEKVLSTIDWGSDDKKFLENINLDLLSKVVIASILGYL